MAKTFVISDTHFGHANIINFCGRPFANADLMDEAMLTYWNETVNEDDIVYHLGDVYLGKTPDFLYSLKGRKRLCLGNHDRGKDQKLHKVFEKIELLYRMPELGIFLSHMPLLDRGLGGTDRELISVHGHIHNKPAPSIHHINVCVEKTDYKPVELEEILHDYYEQGYST